MKRAVVITPTAAFILLAFVSTLLGEDSRTLLKTAHTAVNGEKAKKLGSMHRRDWYECMGKIALEMRHLDPDESKPVLAQIEKAIDEIRSEKDRKAYRAGFDLFVAALDGAPKQDTDTKLQRYLEAKSKCEHAWYIDDAVCSVLGWIDPELTVRLAESGKIWNVKGPAYESAARYHFWHGKPADAVPYLDKLLRYPVSDPELAGHFARKLVGLKDFSTGKKLADKYLASLVRESKDARGGDAVERYDFVELALAAAGYARIAPEKSRDLCVRLEAIRKNTVNPFHLSIQSLYLAYVAFAQGKADWQAHMKEHLKYNDLVADELEKRRKKAAEAGKHFINFEMPEKAVVNLWLFRDIAFVDPGFISACAPFIQEEKMSADFRTIWQKIRAGTVTYHYARENPREAEKMVKLLADTDAPFDYAKMIIAIVRARRLAKAGN